MWMLRRAARGIFQSIYSRKKDVTPLLQAKLSVFEFVRTCWVSSCSIDCTATESGVSSSSLHLLKSLGLLALIHDFI